MMEGGQLARHWCCHCNSALGARRIKGIAGATTGALRVSTSLLEKMKIQVQEIFNLPIEQKKKFWQRPDEIEGFGQGFVFSEEQKLNWGDRFYMVTLPTCLRKPHLLSNLALGFRSTMKLLELMAKALGMDPGDTRVLFEEEQQAIRMSYYPPCPQPELWKTKANKLQPYLRAEQAESLSTVPAAPFFQQVDPDSTQLEEQQHGNFRPTHPKNYSKSSQLLVRTEHLPRLRVKSWIQLPVESQSKPPAAAIESFLLKAPPALALIYPSLEGEEMSILGVFCSLRPPWAAMLHRETPPAAEAFPFPDEGVERV
ncbi:putative Senescence-related protein 1 [Hibiscus syriacus]|uniref:Senescence-related protein 1 n=1 Tax=Hibiscus syriacus TaxID=106335 RepID=A0A6A3CRY2_HIBSY|nr:putative Senescence-related protein 1 [Hibiscus syriacus]